MGLLSRVKAAVGAARASWSQDPSWGPGWDALVPAGVRATAGVGVSPDTALNLVAVYAAINVIATDLAALPLKVYRKRPSGGGRDVVTDHPVHELLNVSPDGETTPMRHRQAMIGHTLGWGNGFSEITFDQDGYPNGIYLMDVRHSDVYRDEQTRELWYQSGGVKLRPYQVLHWAGLGFDGVKGYSPIRKAREAVGLAVAAERYGAAFFGNGSQPKGILKTPQKIDEKTAHNLRESWEAIHRGPDAAHRVAILSQGLEWQSISIAPEDAQFLATRKFQVEEICRLFRLPPNKLADLSNAHLANIEASNLDYLTTTIAPWCRAIEQECNRKLFTADERREGLYVEHDMRALMRGDMKARAEFYRELRDLGVLSPNQICDLENLNPIGPDGDLRLVPLNMTSLANAGQPTADTSGGGATGG